MATETQMPIRRENRSDAERISSYLLTRCSTGGSRNGRASNSCHCRVGCEKPVSGNCGANFRIEKKNRPRGRGPKNERNELWRRYTSKNQAQAKSAGHGRKYGGKPSHVIPLWNGILEHREKIGPALWSSSGASTKSPWRMSTASAGASARPHRHKRSPGPRRAPDSAYDNLSRLAAEGYIIRKRTRAAMPSASPIPERLTLSPFKK